VRVLFVNDTGARLGNPGCQLTSRTLTQVLGDAGLATDPLPWKFARHAGPGSRALWRSLGQGQFLHEPTLRELAGLEYGPQAVAMAQASDLILFQPEGTISDHHPLLRIARLLSLPLWAALHGRVPVVVANGTFPLLSDHRAEPIALLMQHADRVMLRDAIAARHWQVDHVPDSAVLWDGAPRTDGTGLLITTAAEGDAATDLAIGRAGVAVAAALGLRPLVLTKGWKRLLPLQDKIAGLGGEILRATDLDAADRVIATCRLHLGGRYHMALLCATKGIPSALVRSNTHKNLWLAEEFDGIRLAPDPAGLSEVAMQAVRVDPARMLADLARLRAQTRQGYATLAATADLQRVPRPAQPLSASALSHLRREALRDRWAGLVRRALGG